MHFRRLASFLLGAWLMGSVFMDVVATQNFRSVDLLLADPSLGASAQIREMGPDQARVFLRHHAAEQNRAYFELWERVQLALGLVLFLVLLFGSAPSKLSLGLCVAMFVVVLAARLLLTPEIAKLGRSTDFVLDTTSSPERSRFRTFHGAYSGLELAKLGIGLTLTATLLFRGRRDRKRFSREVDRIDKADNGRVDR